MPTQGSSCYGMMEESREKYPMFCIVYVLYWGRCDEAFRCVMFTVVTLCVEHSFAGF
jgi:hypothetical protein